MPNINIDELRDRIAGCWLGKSIGGTLGGPFEGRREILDVTGFTSPAGEPLPNDDLDLQLVWLKAASDRGPLGVNSHVLAEYWINHIPPPWNEYGIGKANLRAGLLPPLSGEFGNVWKHSNGAWIRSEVWACLAPGCPDLAIKYAYEDASVDHGGGEGTYAELFTAALQSAAFVVHDRDELIRIGLSKIPGDCRVARSIKLAMQCFEQGMSWKEAREAVVADSSDLGWFQAPANVAFVIIGWLYGEDDFGKSICIAVNCGDDTDCTGATLGATLGILLGHSGIPKEWSEPIGEKIVTIAIDRGSRWDYPRTIGELTDEVMTLVPEFLRAGRTGLGVSSQPTDLSSLVALDDPKMAQRIWAKSPFAVEFDFIHTKCLIDYLREPTIKPSETMSLALTLINQMPDHRHMKIRFLLPDGWIVSPNPSVETLLLQDQTKRLEFTVTAPEQLDSMIRGVIEVVGVGRPNVGLVPLTFFVEG